MAYFKTRMQGEPRTVNGTTGAGTATKMPNSGISVIGNTTTEVFVLEPPVTGCRKTIIITSLTTTVLPVIRCSTASNGAISFVGATTGMNLMTVAGTRSTVAATVIELIGVNSTSWVVANVCPGSSTATINLAVTLSSGA
jgi:hypothetical protein